MTQRGQNKARTAVIVKRSDDSQLQWLALMNDEVGQLPVEEAFTLSCAFVDQDGTRTSLR